MNVWRILFIMGVGIFVDLGLLIYWGIGGFYEDK